jgi:hypothetical protein
MVEMNYDGAIPGNASDPREILPGHSRQVLTTSSVRSKGGWRPKSSVLHLPIGTPVGTAILCAAFAPALPWLESIDWHAEIVTLIWKSVDDFDVVQGAFCAIRNGGPTAFENTGCIR